ncbi:5-formyltetrahydrofolate cyclo-ligase [Niveibacterium sp.]|uniref:5-formyltetrahydrofolate cyclo-ligase n=1 Tax=Niveibacterium sp. TaxID=2017444 RepID=UPI0035B06DB1
MKDSTLSSPSTVPEAAPDKALRQEMRRRAIAAREALDAAERQHLTAQLCAQLSPLLTRLAPRCLGFCWPYRGEPDLVAFVADWLADDGARVAALPVVLGAEAPLTFAAWRPGVELVGDAFGIPVPAQREVVDPDVVLVPLNAFDNAGYRLGYGGGFFDRTLAARVPAPVAVGVGFELGRVASIRPEPHDMPLDWIVTESGMFGPFRGKNPI